MASFPISPRFTKHQEEIVDFFKGNLINDSSASLLKNKKVGIICFTNRCGSNALLETLCLHERVKSIGEAINHPVVKKKSRENGYKSFSDYLESYFSDASECVIFKASVDQLIFLYKYKILEKCFPEAKFISLKRKDVVSQAVSLYVADKDKKWTSQHSAKDVDIEFDEDKIMKLAKNISMDNADFDLFFSILGVKSKEIYYERLLKNKFNLAEELWDFLEVGGVKPEINSHAGKVKKQISHRKSDFVSVINEKYGFS